MSTQNDKKSQSSIGQIKSKIKVVFLGDQSTGKTSILLRFIHNKFEQGQSATVGIDFMAKNITINSINLRLQLWDTAGQQRFRSLIPSYLKDATVTFIIFDLTNFKSFQNVKQWIQLCQSNKKQKSIMILVGNKFDLHTERKVQKQLPIKLAQNQNIPYFQVSAKTNHNIKEIFLHAAQIYVQDNFSNQMTIGNIQNIHNHFLNQQKKNHQHIQESPPNYNLTNLQHSQNQQKKKKICC